MLKALSSILLCALTLSSFANPDLVIRNVRVADGSATVPPPGEGAALIRFEVRNIGDQTAQRFRIGGYVTPSSSCSNNNGLRLVDSGFVNQLPAGQSLELEFPLTSAPGDVRIFARVVADIDGVVIENNEFNNCNQSFVLDVVYPDLIVSSTVGSSSIKLVPGESGANLVFTLENQTRFGANWNADASTTGIYLSQQASEPPESDRLPGSDLFTPPIAAGDTYDAMTEITIPADTPLGTYNIFAKADANNQVNEGANEDNNFSIGLEVEVVDVCTFSDFNGSGAVDVLDLVSLVNNMGRRVIWYLRHLNVKKSQAPFPEVLNTIDLHAAIGCWGNRSMVLPEGGDLHDIDLQLHDEGYNLVADVSGNISSIESYVLLPSSARLNWSRLYDPLLSGFTKYQSTHSNDDDINGRYSINTFKEVGYHRALTNNTYPLQYFTTLQDLDLLNLQPLEPSEPFITGIAVQVVFADLTTAMMVKKFDYVHAPDRMLHNALSASFNLASGSPIPGALARTVTALDLSHAEITSLEGILAFENLETLILDDNALTTLPNLTSLTQLQKLSVAGNALFRLPTLPPQLQELNLSNNDLTRLQDLSSLQALQKLDVSLNALASLPHSLTNLQQLRELRCSYNELTEIPALPQTVEALYADHNMLSRVPDFAPNTLKQLHVNDNVINLISNLQSAVHLDMQAVILSNNMLDTRSCQVLVFTQEALKKSGGLYAAENQAYDLAICGLVSIAL